MKSSKVIRIKCADCKHSDVMTLKVLTQDTHVNNITGISMVCNNCGSNAVGLDEVIYEQPTTKPKRVVAFINISNIVVDRHSISPQTLDLASKIETGVVSVDELPPIHVQRSFDNSHFILKDGRHLVTAFKLLGLKKIKAKYSTQKSLI